MYLPTQSTSQASKWIYRSKTDAIREYIHVLPTNIQPCLSRPNSTSQAHGFLHANKFSAHSTCQTPKRMNTSKNDVAQFRVHLWLAQNVSTSHPTPTRIYNNSYTRVLTSYDDNWNLGYEIANRIFPYHWHGRSDYSNVGS